MFFVRNNRYTRIGSSCRAVLREGFDSHVFREFEDRIRLDKECLTIESLEVYSTISSAMSLQWYMLAIFFVGCKTLNSFKVQFVFLLIKPWL
jgi:hypothetical protein